MKLREKLLNIQVELNAPKSQYNNFGGYHYRSTEDILGAVKPLLKKYQASLKIEDDIKLVGDRYYVQATAILYDTASDDYIQATAYARESDSKKGMDSSQLTGATSSYARKYALNGLFAIDDVKDSDYHQGDNQAPNTSNRARNTASSGQGKDDLLRAINGYIKDGKVSVDQIKTLIENTFNKNSSNELTVQEARQLLQMIKGA